ncbi:Glu/Leu/Phe/Val dehydrogenase dimerization domain-containing protein [Spirillospora sp. CA-294931]|uniref:Glu/Leu/Phe/Val dehydrogenase dimerization domain-containing protein n=1 Tax=Spirillospora sp. CA-294931 TaxID=3240042 RepID=UPI003D8CEE26
MLEHEDIRVRRGRRSGVAVIVAVHSRTLGPAIGGCRMRRYAGWREGVEDALRLSEAMSLKCAVSGVPFGGGKSVIALPPGIEVTPALRRAALEDLGELIESFDGSYITGPDIGTGPDDMLVIKERTEHVFCLPTARGGTGSSSGPTASGVLASLRAAAARTLGTEDLAGRTAVVIGLGAVGAHLARSLRDQGAKVIVTDIDPAKRGLASAEGLGWIEPDRALHTPADVLIPAAVGGLLGPAQAAAIEAPLIVGPTNNQLTDDAVADLLAERGITWVPDFVASAGGIIHTLAREIDELDDVSADARVEEIATTTATLLDKSKQHGTTPLREAHRLAAQRLTPRQPQPRARLR